MDLQTIQNKNPQYQIQALSAENFSDFGQMYANYDLTGVQTYMAQVKQPATGLLMMRLIKQLAKTTAFYKLRLINFRVCQPKSVSAMDILNNLTWLNITSSEINIFFTDAVLVLGSRQDAQGLSFDPNEHAQIFFVPAGSVLEFCATTLHYAPIEIDEQGIKTIVILPSQTGSELPADYQTTNELVEEINKFAFAHQNSQSRPWHTRNRLTGELITFA